MPKIRSLEEVRADVAAIEAEIEQLKAKAESEAGLTPEEAARLEELVAQLEAAKTEEVAASANERYVKLKAGEDKVQRTLPVYVSSPKHSDEGKLGRAIGHWLHGNRTPEAVERMRACGFDPHRNFATVPFDPRRINFKQRTVLSTGGSGTGSEWASYKTYSDQVFEYLTYENPLLGFLKTDSLDNGRERYYFDLNDTSLIATDITATAGTELSPTIPETNIASGRKEIQPKTITTGYQKVTHEMLQDSPFDLESKIAAASTKGMARKMDSDVINGSGNGVTGVEGLLAVCTALDDVAAWDLDALEGLWDAVPDYYRPGSIFLSNATTKSAVRRELKDGNERSYFDKAVIADQQFDTLFGNTWVVSAYMPDNQVLFFNPNHYTLVVVNNQIFQRFDEKFFSHIAWAGMMRFGGALTGDSAAFQSLTRDDS
ncbi:phage major capsid protein [bacterium]|nr:phage major capsid protein [bacterium]